MTDLDIIKRIQQELSVSLRELEVDELEYDPGYSLNQSGYVTHLSLYHCDLININRILSLLKNLNYLEYLALDNNQLSEIPSLKESRSIDEVRLIKKSLTDISSLRELEQLTDVRLIRESAHRLFSP